MTVKFKKIDKDAILPSYAHPGDAGMDLHCLAPFEIAPGERKLVRTGLSMELPSGTEAQVRPRSGLAVKNGITVLNSPGTIDSGYRGEIGVILINLGSEKFAADKGAKIAQMVIARYESAEIAEVSSIEDSERGTGGFGSTGL